MTNHMKVNKHFREGDCGGMGVRGGHGRVRGGEGGEEDEYEMGGRGEEGV